MSIQDTCKVVIMCAVNACLCVHIHAGFTVVSLAILGDNYCYVVVDDTSKIAVAVDPADPEAVMVLYTHSHISAHTH